MVCEPWEHPWTAPHLPSARRYNGEVPTLILESVATGTPWGRHLHLLQRNDFSEIYVCYISIEVHLSRLNSKMLRALPLPHLQPLSLSPLQAHSLSSHPASVRAHAPLRGPCKADVQRALSHMQAAAESWGQPESCWGQLWFGAAEPRLYYRACQHKLLELLSC